eukprot:CAMPEP_0115628210 /NCGR_PEP_ID=MMETSP0272-20121206/29280_1 /TAXON_ID=71861 /ORGANISM="Scrippsiella trochoidea, Strain CCMP3099" /LENGTH=148 /DNA_ID=CAMNT_0003064665 /DNA_START=449 /DNA_END=894 /DNA_ORIENTATION=+
MTLACNDMHKAAAALSREPGPHVGLHLPGKAKACHYDPASATEDAVTDTIDGFLLQASNSGPATPWSYSIKPDNHQQRGGKCNQTGPQLAACREVETACRGCQNPQRRATSAQSAAEVLPMHCNSASAGCFHSDQSDSCPQHTAAQDV